MSAQSPILQALGYDESGLKALLAPVYAQGSRGEAYFSRSANRKLVMVDRQIQPAVVESTAGGALRRIHGLVPDFVSFTGLTAENLAQAKADLLAIPTGTGGAGGTASVPDFALPQYYAPDDVFLGKTDDDWKRLLQEVDDYVRSADKRIVQATIQMMGEGTDVFIMRHDGRIMKDYRPMSFIVISVVARENGREAMGHGNMVSRHIVAEIFKPENWKPAADRAVEIALNGLSAIAAPSGNNLDVVITNGQGGVILHEAFGHGLEADFHMKGIASLQGRIGQRVAAKGVNIVEDGTVPYASGTQNFDDEGNPTRRNLLVEDGILNGLITDEISAAALNMPLTGNGRRESFMHRPMPRMTNTYMLGGEESVERLIADVKHGIYCTAFTGGQVDIITGKFVFVTSEARMIENGKLGAFVKGASLQGMGNTAYLGVNGVANDKVLKAGMCGKNGQTVRVNMGQPTIRIKAGEIVVGGTGA